MVDNVTNALPKAKAKKPYEEITAIFNGNEVSYGSFLVYLDYVHIF